MAIPTLVISLPPRKVVASVLEVPGATVVLGTTPVVPVSLPVTLLSDATVVPAVLNPPPEVPAPSVEVVA